MDNRFKKYAESIIKYGINIKEGQCINIACGIYYYDFALLLAEFAYKYGAKYVEIDVRSTELKKRRIEFSKDNYLSYLPEYIINKNEEMISNDWALIRIEDNEELDVLKNADATKIGILSRESYIKNNNLMSAIDKNYLKWCVLSYPGPEWANKVYEDKNEDRLKDALSRILYLDYDNPGEKWIENSKKIQDRANFLNSKKIRKIRFKSKDTDLTIGLTPSSLWMGGGDYKKNEEFFLPNIPSEEIFTTPDYREVNGCVRITKPVEVLGKIVEDIYLEYKNGKLVGYNASKNKDILEKYIAIDENASNIGEVALVDKNSPIYKENILFYSGLLDENASCHIALGNGYPSCLSNLNELDDNDKLLNYGCNISLVHTDFMIGSDDMNIYAETFDGNNFTIIENGIFVI